MRGSQSTFHESREQTFGLLIALLWVMRRPNNLPGQASAGLFHLARKSEHHTGAQVHPPDQKSLV